MIIDEDQHLSHYGVLRRSGRYPWGTHGWGAGTLDDNHKNMTFLDFVDHLKKQGLNEAEIAKGFGMTLLHLRAKRTIELNAKKQSDIAMAQALKDKGNSNVAIGKRMGVPESTVRNLLAPGAKAKADILVSTSDMLKRQVDDKKFVDVGTGVEGYLHVSKENLRAAVAILEEKGYKVHPIKIPQPGTSFETTHKVLTPPGTTWADVKKNQDNIKQIGEVTDDFGRTFTPLQDPISVSPNRVLIKHSEEGGAELDGVLFVRPGVKDVSLGENRYAQVRVKVGKNHYIKGMAMYKNDLPAGTDIVFHTSKSKNDTDVLKPLKADKDLPFGAIVRQIFDRPTGDPKAKVSSAMNLVNEEGDWGKWSKSLSSQFLSKQSPTLAKTQLEKSLSHRKQDLNEITSLTNPVVKKDLLLKFADSADSASTQLKAAALNTRQAWHAILPIESIKESEVYAPRYRDGERVVLIRHPHGGTFEIPELTVNNKNKEARGLLGDAPDAVGIHHTVAQRLSGADFDGDTVLVIPNNKGQIKHTPALEGLKDFNPRLAYPKYPGMVPIGNRKQQMMGDISNLITDMTIKGAPPSDIARAIRHSMVVIDADKHELNWKLSEERNGIKQLKTEYQGGANKGASTLISKARSPQYVPQRTLRKPAEGGPIDTKTGRKVFTPTGRTKVNTTTGAAELVRERSNKMAETEDAHALSSGTRIEGIYADHANNLKGLANSARLHAFNTPTLKSSASARKVYADQVSSLDSKIKIARRNAPLERQASVIANAVVRAKLKANPDLDKESKKKIRIQALETARLRTGANKTGRQIHVTPEEWDAIQAGAISNTRLEEILRNTDVETIRKYAMPRHVHVMTPAKTSRALGLLASGAYTRAQVADILGVSLTTLMNTLHPSEVK